jgi:hypothetical protein
MGDPVEGQIADEGRLHRLLDTILETAVEALGFHAATVSARSGDKLATVAVTDERMLDLDFAQYDAIDGPCIEAFDSPDPVYAEDLSLEDRWHTFREAAEAVGVRTTLSLHIDSAEEVATSLNLYARHVRRLGDADVRAAATFAVQLAAALHGPHMQRATARVAGQLADGLRVRAHIEQAKGVLMAERGITPDEALRLLHDESRETNVRIGVVAARLLMDRRDGLGAFLAP